MVYGIFNTMSIQITIDKAGRMVLPKPVRMQLHLEAGSILELDMGLGEVILRPRQVETSGIRQYKGRAVWDAPEALATADEFEAARLRGRDERDQRFLDWNE
jgi:AbrB family looped-hinge helix DNA binding protein